MTRMRVALVGDYPLDPSRISGGPQAVLAYLLEGLKQFDRLDLHVVSANKQIRQASQFQRDNVTFHFVPHPRLPLELGFFVLRQRLRHVLQQIGPDLVHVQSAIVYSIIYPGTRYATIVTTHNLPGTEAHFAPNWINQRRLSLHQKWMSRIFFEHARHVATISEYIREGLDPHMQANFYPLDNPVADAFFELPSDQSVPARLLFVGLLGRRKRPDLALEALALARQEIPELHLQFAGAAIDPALHAKMRELVAQNALERNVEFLGHLSEMEVLGAYREASVLLLTSELETSPMVVQQAMAAGKAVVATKVGGVPFLINDRRTGLLAEPNNAQQIAEALIELALDPEFRQNVAEAARQEARRRFKPEVVAAKVYAIYQEILDSKWR